VLRLQRQYAQAEITAIEQDRARIAADIHDDLAPTLVAVKMKISSFDLEDPEDQYQLESTNQAIDDLAKRLRSISFNLMPSTLKAKGLETAIREFVSFMSREDQLQVRFWTAEEPLFLPEEATIHTYRMVQEIVQNTVKHAQATELYISLKREQRYLMLQTKDNGQGFDYERMIQKEGGLGLRSLLNRANLLRAEFQVDSEEGKGTAYTIQIPLTDD
jgi:signal transduction histidine kinase